MNMLRHHYIADDDEVIASTHLLQHSQELITILLVAQQGLATIATGGDEVQVATSVATMETSRHASS
jgi:hypothetical protein